jgi:hypothetical protein
VAEIAATPGQWSFWDMVAEAAAGFAPDVRRQVLTPGLHGDYRRAFVACLDRAPDTVRLELEREIEVWPGDVLADLSGDRFYTAEGLAVADLPLLRAGCRLGDLVAARGRDWVSYHGLRLCLLGLACLRGAPGHPPLRTAP